MIVDEFVTRLTLESAAHARGAQQVKRSNNEVERSEKSLVKTVKDSSKDIKDAKKSEAQAAKSAADQWRDSLDRVDAKLLSATGGFVGLSGAISIVTVGLTAAAAAAVMYAKANVEIAKASFELFEKFSEYDAQVKALDAVTGSAQATAAAMKELREIAKMPGLGMAEAISGYTGLLRTGLTPEEAMRYISEFGNANAQAGGGRAELDAVFRAIRQILTKPYLQGEEINQLEEAGIMVRPILKKRFGTGDSEELKKQGYTSKQISDAIVDELGKTARVANSAKNSLENMRDAIDRVGIGIGEGVATKLTPAISQFGDELEELIGSGSLQALGASMGRTTTSAADLSLAIAGKEGSGLNEVMSEGAVYAIMFSDALTGANMMLKSITETLGKIGPYVEPFIRAIPGGNAALTWRDILMGGRQSAEAQVAAAYFEAKAKGLTIEDALGRPVDKEGVASVEAGGDMGGLISTMLGLMAPGTETTGYLSEIAGNTARMAATMERAALGGGDLGALGISRVDLNRRAGRGGRGSGARMFGDLMAPIMHMPFRQGN